MTNPIKDLKAIKNIKSMKLEGGIAIDKLDRDEQIKKKKLIDSAYPFEEHGL